MADPYPFKGIWRWVVLPTLLTLAGILASAVGAWAGEAGRSDIGYWLIPGFVKAAVEGGSLAIGKRPFVALAAVFVLGGSAVWVEQGVTNASVGGGGPPDSRIITILGYGGMSALMVVVHHLYLRTRRAARWKAVAAGLLYPAAAIAGILVYVYVLIPYGEGEFRIDLLLWGAAEGLLAWLALAVAARLSERATASATVQ